MAFEPLLDAKHKDIDFHIDGFARIWSLKGTITNENERCFSDVALVA
jgi:hypothetical protein